MQRPHIGRVGPIPPLGGFGGFPMGGFHMGGQNRRRDPFFYILVVQLLHKIYELPNKPPVTLGIMALCTAVHFAKDLSPDMAALIPPLDYGCLSPFSVVHGGQWPRLLWSAILHASDYHLYYNMSSLLLKGVQLELRVGPKRFGALVAWLTLLSQGLYALGAFWVGESYPRWRSLSRAECACGLSGLLFALKYALTHDQPGFSTVWGLPISLPTKYIAWAELLLIHYLIPNTSFAGHLAGICAGALHVHVLSRLTSWDAIVQMLDRDLEEAEEQYGLAVRAHMMVLDSLLDLQHQRMRALEAEFGAQLKALEEEFEAERTEIVNAHVRQKKDMHDMIAKMESEFQDSENELRQEYEAAREEIKNRNSEEYNVLKIQLEGIIEELERHFEQAHKAYLESTEHRTQAFKQLTRNDNQAARVIEKRMRKLVKLQEALVHWRTKIATNSREWEERNRALRNEKEIMGRHYAALKAGMDGFRAQQGDRLKRLTLASSAAMGELNAKLSTAENILKLCELCRKHETEQEKVVPFYTTPVVADAYAAGEEEAAAAAASAAAAAEERALDDADQAAAAQERAAAAAKGLLDAGGPSTSGRKAGAGSMGGAGGASPPRVRLSSVGTDDKGGEVEEWDYLNRFFRRFNKAVLDKAAIDKEKARLEKENADLRSILKQYLDGISVNDDVMNNPINPLLVVNNRLQVTLAERNKARQQALALRAAAAQGSPSASQGVPQLVLVGANAGGGAGGQKQRP